MHVLATFDMMPQSRHTRGDDSIGFIHAEMVFFNVEIFFLCWNGCICVGLISFVACEWLGEF